MSQNNQNKFHWKKWHSAVVVLALLGAGGVYYANTATQRPSSAPSVTTQSKQAASPKMQKPKTKRVPKKLLQRSMMSLLTRLSQLVIRFHLVLSKQKTLWAILLATTHLQKPLPI